MELYSTHSLVDAAVVYDRCLSWMAVCCRQWRASVIPMDWSCPHSQFCLFPRCSIQVCDNYDIHLFINICQVKTGMTHWGLLEKPGTTPPRLQAQFVRVLGSAMVQLFTVANLFFTKDNLVIRVSYHVDKVNGYQSLVMYVK